VPHRDVVLALLGAASGLGGLVLVFLGVVVSTMQSFGGATPAGVLDRYRRAAGVTLAAFALAVADTAVAFAWLLRGGGDSLYAAAAVLFGILLGAVLLVAASVTRMLVWR
jgi:hypothetical protein